MTSVDAPVGGEERDSASLAEFIPAAGTSPEEEVTVHLGHEALLRAVTALPEQERRVIELRYGLTAEGVVSLTGVCRRLEMPIEQVRMIERRALERLSEERELQSLS